MLTMQAHRLVARQLLELYVQQHEDGLSTYPVNMSWLHPMLNGTLQDIQDPHHWALPFQGVLEFSFSDRRPPPDVTSLPPLSPLRFRLLCARLANLSTADGNALLASPTAAEVKAWFGTPGSIPSLSPPCVSELLIVLPSQPEGKQKCRRLC